MLIHRLEIILKISIDIFSFKWSKDKYLVDKITKTTHNIKNKLNKILKHILIKYGLN